MDNNRKKPEPRDDVLTQYFREICVRYGFCLAPLVKQSLIDKPGASASTFVKKIILAEGVGSEGISEYFDTLYSCLSAEARQCFNSP